MPTMVRMPGEDGEGAIDLLSQDQARQRMGKRELAKRQKKLGTAFGGIRPAIGWPNGKHDMLRPFIAASADPGGEGFGGHLPAAAVEEDGERWRTALTPLEPLEECTLGAEVSRLTRRISAAALYILASETIELIPGRGPGCDMSQCQAHGMQDIEGECVKAREKPVPRRSLNTVKIGERSFSFSYNYKLV